MGIQPSTIFSESAGKKTYDYIYRSKEVINDQYFDQNDTLSAMLSISSSFSITSLPAGSSITTNSLVSNGAGYLLLPMKDFTGVCNDNNYGYVRFLFG